jgi:translation initiation factor IF-2
MSQQTTIRKLAELVNTPVEKLLEQLAEAGMSFSGPDQVVTSIEKVKLLGFLKRAHGRAEAATETGDATKKITLSRSRKQEITVGDRRNRTTVDVVVRKKVTLVKPGAETPAQESALPVDDERADALRKLEASRNRNVEEQERLAERDRKRAAELDLAAAQRKPNAPSWPRQRPRLACSKPTVARPLRVHHVLAMAMRRRRRSARRGAKAPMIATVNGSSLAARTRWWRGSRTATMTTSIASPGSCT